VGFPDVLPWEAAANALINLTRPLTKKVDARSTVEMSDRYVILPDAYAARRRHYLDQGATPTPDGFCYASDRNPEDLDARGLQQLLAQALSGRS
jgi:hypothetical protein